MPPRTSASPSRRSGVEPFHVMEVLKAAAQRQRTHGDVLMLCAGQPSTPAPAAARSRAVEVVDAEVLGYTESTGILPLREAIARHHRRSAGVDVSPEDVVVFPGSSGAFTALFLAAFDVGDTVAMTRPGYPAYRNTLQALGCRVLELDCGAATRYQPTVAMLDALPEPPAGLIVASPANPTGTIIDSHVLAELTEWCEEHGTLLISDEIYHGLSYGRPTASAWETSREAVVVGSVSKYFSMTGWRLGWLLAPAALRRPLEVLTGNLNICAPAISQHAALGAFTEQARVELDGHRDRYAATRDLLIRRLPEVGLRDYAPPDGAFYAWCDVGHLTDDSVTWCRDLLDDCGVAITPGVDFDTAQGHTKVRLSFAGSTAEVAEALDRMAASPLLRGRG
ncbi:aminotransferase class I/II-fold pyridoxal phosphate-dependent enzyme [Ornithinimicrobium cerasi]|uniref:Aminotransferase n=1 Tax=Ornithinimicrobium cerasi TaxID=2248773 RepID=A0A285VVY8_9MICO|nr:aminotransferase class I/II-fold pyridoxal phosphate-dependent enzyme [Ornithinimicrobium cerasi]SOC56791.1 Aspartate/methionine/tyrosine aminotransferase [Ornithinimicrobium cerasi]